MFAKLVSLKEAAYLLDIDDSTELEAAIRAGHLKAAESGRKGMKFKVGDLTIFKLAQVITHTGVEPDKAVRYAEAILGTRMPEDYRNIIEWIENEKQELFCFIADAQLSRIFLRNKEDAKELDVGAVKPVLLPTTRCEINVFRVIRPVIYRARQLFARK